MRFRIRCVREEDAESILGVLNPIIQDGRYTILDEQISVAAQREFIRTFPERGVFHVAEDSERQEIVGLQDVQPMHSGTIAFQHVGEISTYVSLRSRGAGIGRGLSEATLRSAQEQGFVKLVAAIRADNAPAISFYRSLDFTVVGTLKKQAFIRGRYLDQILAERLLG